MDLNQFFTIDMIGTMAGMTAFVMLLTQITKWIVSGTVVEKLNTKWYALFWSLIGNGAILVFSQDMNAQSIFSAIINVLLVAAAATGVFDGARTIKTTAQKKTEGESGE